jgi:hypothetical protein
MHEVRRHARDEVSTDCGAHSIEASIDQDGIITIDSKDSHYPKNEASLSEVVIVEGVHELTEVRPDMPSWSEDKLLLMMMSLPYSFIHLE